MYTQQKLSIQSQPNRLLFKVQGLKKILFVLSLCMCGWQIHAHLLNPSQITEIKKHTSKISPGFSEDFIRLGSQCFATIGADTFFNVEGTNMVFLIKKGNAIRLDKSVFHGSTFYRHFFAYNSVLYLLGGYGMFNTHANLQYFSVDSKEWEIRKTTGTALAFINSLIYQNKDYICTGYNFKNGNGVYANIIDQRVYKLNLKNFVWEELPLKMNSEFEEIQGQEMLKNASVGAYTFYHSALWGMVVNTEGNAAKFLLHPQGLRGHIKCVGFIPPDTLIMNMSGSSDDKYESIKISLGKIMLHATPLFVDKRENNLSRLSSFVGIVGGGLAALGLIYFGFGMYKRRRETARTHLEKLLGHHFDAMSKYKGKNVTADFLDELLGIHHMELGSKRMKRFRLLKDINQVRPNYIKRIHDPVDGRKYSYRIH